MKSLYLYEEFYGAMSETTKHAGTFHLYPNLIKAETDRGLYYTLLHCSSVSVFSLYYTIHIYTNISHLYLYRLLYSAASPSAVFLYFLSIILCTSASPLYLYKYFSPVSFNRGLFV